MNYEQAAAVPLTALAAWQTLVDFAQVQSGERVLIHGAGGNGGSFAVQLAKNQGARTSTPVTFPVEGHFFESWARMRS